MRRAKEAGDTALFNRLLWGGDGRTPLEIQAAHEAEASAEALRRPAETARASYKQEAAERAAEEAADRAAEEEEERAMGGDYYDDGD